MLSWWITDREGCEEANSDIAKLRAFLQVPVAIKRRYCGYEVFFERDGSIKFGCVTLTCAQMAEISRIRAAVMSGTTPVV